MGFNLLVVPRIATGRWRRRPPLMLAVHTTECPLNAKKSTNEQGALTHFAGRYKIQYIYLSRARASLNCSLQRLRHSRHICHRKCSWFGSLFDNYASGCLFILILLVRWVVDTQSSTQIMCGNGTRVRTVLQHNLTPKVLEYPPYVPAT